MRIRMQVHLKSGKAAKGIVVESKSRKDLSDKFISDMSKRKKKFFEIEGNNETLIIPRESIDFIVLEDL